MRERNQYTNGEVRELPIHAPWWVSLTPFIERIGFPIVAAIGLAVGGFYFGNKCVDAIRGLGADVRDNTAAVVRLADKLEEHMQYDRFHDHR